MKKRDKAIKELATNLYDELFKNIEDHGDAAIEIYMQAPLNIAATVANVLERNNATEKQKESVNLMMKKHLISQSEAILSAASLWGRMSPKEFFIFCMESRANDDGKVFESDLYAQEKLKESKEGNIQ